jgi:electron transfer flavoprotein beta subunit
MTIVVAYKWAANPSDATVLADGRIDWSRARPALSEYDSVAINGGHVLAGAVGEECVGVTAGPGSASPIARKTALARGLDRGLAVDGPETADWNRTRTAQALAGLIRRIEDVHLVLTGEASVDSNASMMSALVAGCLGWPCFQSVAGVDAAGSGWRLSQTEGGSTREIETPGPVVVALTAAAFEAPIPGLRQIMAAASKPFDSVPPADLDLSAPTPQVASRRQAPTTVRARQILTGDDAPARLVTSLRVAGVID